jgi:alcohol dehydrogenase class IV
MGDRCAGIYDGVLAHSPVESVQDAAKLLQDLQADAVLALGGGSSIVTARAGSILAAEKGDVRTLCTTRDASGKLFSPKLMAAKLPQLIVPTTPTTAMVKAGAAVFDPSTGARLALFDPKVRAQAIFIHPDLIQSSPSGLIVSAGLNTLSMAIEGLVSRSGDPLADASLMHALRLSVQYLPNPALGEDPAVRAELMLAAVLCGQGSDFAGAGITTVLGHAVGARHHIDNGVVNAIVLPHAIRFNGMTAGAGLHKVATALGLAVWEGEALVEAVASAIEALFSKLGIAKRLREVGVLHDGLPEIAANAIDDWFLKGNPRPVRDASELRQILEQCW